MSRLTQKKSSAITDDMISVYAEEILNLDPVLDFDLTWNGEDGVPETVNTTVTIANIRARFSNPTELYETLADVCQDLPEGYCPATPLSAADYDRIMRRIETMVEEIAVGPASTTASKKKSGGDEQGNTDDAISIAKAHGVTRMFDWDTNIDDTISDMVDINESAELCISSNDIGHEVGLLLPVTNNDKPVFIALSTFYNLNIPAMMKKLVPIQRALEDSGLGA